MKRPLNHSIVLSSVAFIAIVCVSLCVVTYFGYRQALYGLYEQQMADLLEYVDGHIDHDDLAECVETRQESSKYRELQSFMDDVYTNYDLHYLYILQVEKGADGPQLIDVMTAFWPEDYETDDPNKFFLGATVSRFYPEEEINELQRISDAGELAFFEDESDYGLDYTGALPLKTSSGDVFAVLCVDMPLDKIHDTVLRNMATPVVLMLCLGVLFTTLFCSWARKNIARPILQLERSVTAFAEASHGQGDPSELAYDGPVVRTGNEVEVLSRAIEQMTEDIKGYAMRVANAQSQVELMRTQVSQMDQLARQDALTKVKNKTAYQEAQIALNESIADGTACFGLVMMDINHLKQMNDTFGHERGDSYIMGTSHELCETYKHSPVYRIGGDEFVVILRGSEYERREELLEELKARFREAENDGQRQPWERFSASAGMAVFEEGDASFDDVFARADQAMYHDKQVG